MLINKTDTYLEKSQYTRVFAAVIISPFLIMVGAAFDLPVWIKVALILLGIFSLLFHAAMFYLNMKQNEST